MNIDKSRHYVFRIGSDIQHRIHWNGSSWHYEMLAGGVMFDELKASDENGLNEIILGKGLTFDRFKVDQDKAAAAYSAEIRQKHKKLEELGIQPCAKHGMMAKNEDDTCEACANTDYPDDMKGTEG